MITCLYRLQLDVLALTPWLHHSLPLTGEDVLHYMLPDFASC